MSVEVSVQQWGVEEGVKMVTLTSPDLKVRLLSLGATIHSVIYPGDSPEETRDVVMGFDQASGYRGEDNPFFWGTTGRLTNRVTGGKVVIDGETHQLSLNDFGNKFKHHLHGGKLSFDRRNWETCVRKDGVVFSLLSPHGEEGYPGNLVASVTYRLAGNSSLQPPEGTPHRGEGRGGVSSLAITITAATDRPTVVNISNHVYFNLAGHGAGWEGLQQHTLQVPSEEYTPDDAEYLPTGEVAAVQGTEYDFTRERYLLEAVPSARGGEGYCVNYCTGAGTRASDSHSPGAGPRASRALSRVASLGHPATARKIEVWSDQPGLELYTGNFLPAQEGLAGKGGASYCRWGGLCLMTQNYRDAASHPTFPSPILRPGHLYTHRAVYKFLQK